MHYYSYHSYSTTINQPSRNFSQASTTTTTATTTTSNTYYSLSCCCHYCHYYYYFYSMEKYTVSDNICFNRAAQMSYHSMEMLHYYLLLEIIRVWWTPLNPSHQDKDWLVAISILITKVRSMTCEVTGPLPCQPPPCSSQDLRTRRKTPLLQPLIPPQIMIEE